MIGPMRWYAYSEFVSNGWIWSEGHSSLWAGGQQTALWGPITYGRYWRPLTDEEQAVYALGGPRALLGLAAPTLGVEWCRTV